MKRPSALRIILTLALLQLGLLTSCDQVGMGVKAGLVNLVSQPIEGLRSAYNYVSGNTYSAYMDRTEELRKSKPQTCSDTGLQEKEGALGKLAKVMGLVRDTACKCRPWGSCPPSNCSCEILCPESFDILSVHRQRNLGNVEDELAFSNSPRFFKARSDHQISSGGGFCWGHASVTAQFNRLAFFDPSRKPAIVQAKDPAKWADYYSGLIDRIISNEATEVPGFSNLKEFSEHPVIQTMLANRVAEEWSKKAMTFSALGTAMRSGKSDPADAHDFVKELRRRTSYYQSPQIVFTRLGASFNTHTVLVSEVRANKDGSSRICIRENGVAANSRNQCRQYIDVDRKGAIVGVPYGPIGAAEIAHNEDPDTVEQVNSLVAYCRSKKGCK